jgi:nucleoside-diphosphate-sugar epimerase
MATPAPALRSVFVTGGSGFLGRNLIARLRADGARVAALARSVDAGRTVEVAGADAVMARAAARTIASASRCALPFPLPF